MPADVAHAPASAETRQPGPTCLSRAFAVGRVSAWTPGPRLEQARPGCRGRRLLRCVAVGKMRRRAVAADNSVAVTDGGPDGAPWGRFRPQRRLFGGCGASADCASPLLIAIPSALPICLVVGSGRSDG
jgi:hypothetical protein